MAGGLVKTRLAGDAVSMDDCLACELTAGRQQVYNCLWSHADGLPGHIHYVVQPVTKKQMADYGAHGPSLQVGMFTAGEVPDPEEVERIVHVARGLFAST